MEAVEANYIAMAGPSQKNSAIAWDVDVTDLIE